MTELSLSQRLWRYQAERFPVIKNGILICAFSASCVMISARLGGRDLPGPGAWAVAAVVAFVAFLVLRIADEHKDAETDARYRPERPVPSGLVTLPLLRMLGLAALALQAAAAVLLEPWLLLPLAALWLWIGLMTVEFFVPDWLRDRPALYLISHMAVMPIMVLAVAACDWLAGGAWPAAGLGLLMALSFANGCVLEIGRKTWSPEEEREGVESYSADWGIRLSIGVWLACLAAALALATGLGALRGGALIVVILLAAPAAFGAYAALGMLRAPTPSRTKALEAASGIWLLASYLAAAFGPEIRL